MKIKRIQPKLEAGFLCYNAW